MLAAGVARTGVTPVHIISVPDGYSNHYYLFTFKTRESAMHMYAVEVLFWPAVCQVLCTPLAQALPLAVVWNVLQANECSRLSGQALQ